LIALASVPVTRYKLAGYVIKKTLGVTVVDSVTGKPISGASVSYGGHQATTNATGQALLAAPLGGGELSITKGYYQPYSKTTTIGIGDPSPALKISLVATGRQVSLTILNKLTKEPVTGAIVKVLETSAVTNKAGEVSIVLPTKTDTVTATITAEGYTTSTAEVQVTDGVVPANTISIVPAGKLYFLSTANGTQDVVKTNLDGSDRSVVLAGTGKEDAATSQLIASRDWRYVVVKTRRTATETSLYLIDTATDKQTQFEATNSAYNLIGWSGHNFVYDVVRSTVAASQSGRESIKSYNADQQQLNQLDQTQALGAAASYAALTFSNFFIVDNQLLYTTKWTGGGDTAYDLSSQTNSIRTISVSGQGKKDLQSYPAATFAGIQTAHVLPGRVIYLVASTDGAATYYSYTGGSLSADTSLNPDSFAQPSPVYLPSPDGLKTAWSTVSGKPGLMVGDKNGSNPTSVSGGEYGAYGWYGSKYILLSRGGSSLYILPLGEGKNYTPTKVGDYSQQQIAPASYGGGF
ncbi:MAG: hypothetical protein ABIV43_02715, partial [Candidatus Saccharimonadales bacterium]